MYTGTRSSSSKHATHPQSLLQMGKKGLEGDQSEDDSIDDDVDQYFAPERSSSRPPFHGYFSRDISLQHLQDVFKHESLSCMDLWAEIKEKVQEKGRGAILVVRRK
eukprot:GHVN01052216.1.p7 GENE.GHVN01052216.1~~GHVN01052216.1.p7  ORF type:complete len:106 (+),score=9.36 GHVN01052216.1:2558-2875(+)